MSKNKKNFRNKDPFYFESKIQNKDNNKKEANKVKISKEDLIIDSGDLTLDDIVGQPEAINELKDFVNSIKDANLYSLWHLSAPKGILFTGAPGLGKTASVKALARELGDQVTLMSLDYMDIANKYVDAQIETLKDIFILIEKLSIEKHVLLFLDEIDAIIPSRTKELHETSHKRVNVFLSWLDGGFNKLNNFTLIGATNNVKDLDNAMQRPGRLDRIIEFKELNVQAIINGLKIHLDKKSLSKEFIGTIDWQLVSAKLTDGLLSGADLTAIINLITRDKIKMHKDFINKNGLDSTKMEKSELIKIFPSEMKITEKDFIKTISTYKADNSRKKIGFELSE